MRIHHLGLAAVLSVGSLLFSAPSAHAQSAGLVISQIFGGGSGSATSPYSQDFVELFNGTGSAINLTGYTLQYASTAGNFQTANGQVTALSGTIASGGFFLVGLASGGTNGATIPTADVTGTTNASATNGKFALANDANLVTFTTPNTFSSNVVDFVGYGSANAYEGTGAVTTLGNMAAAVRKLNDLGTNFLDSNDNLNDFRVTTAFTPRNSSSTFGANFVPSGGVAAAAPEPGTLALVLTILPAAGGIVVRRRKARA